jgi:polar amino acid transport system substrate-binding protein
MTITEEAKTNSSVSDPYVINSQVVVMNMDALANYETVEALSGLNIAVESGSAGEVCANEIAGATVIPLQNQEAALMEVAAGTSDACVIDITMANAMTGEGTSYADLTYTVSLTSEEYGIGFAKGSDMPAKVNEVMKKLIENGKLDEIAAKYELTNALISNQK